MGYEYREDAVGGWGSRQWHTHIHTHSVPRDKQDGWSLGQGSDAILTRVSVVGPLTKLVGYEQQEYTVGGGGSRQWQTHTHTNTHTHTHTHTVSPVIHRVDGASGNDQKQS